MATVAGHTMRAMRPILVALLSALAFAAAGCGSEDVGAGGVGAAEMLKAGALVYWETETDPESDQWKQVEELLGRFPDGDKWIAELKKEFEGETKVTWEGDVEPALGEQVAVAVYAKSLQDVSFVGLTKPEDTGKTVALVQKLNASDDTEDDAVTRVVDDWVVISDKQTSIDSALVRGDGGSLADDEGFKGGMAELPDDTLSRVWFDVAAALDAFGDADPATAKSLRMLGLDKIDFAGAWAKARDDGAEIAGALRGEGADKLFGAAEAYKSSLLDLVPADAFAFTTFQGEGTTAQLRDLRSNPLYGMALQGFEEELGVEIDDVLNLFRGEVAFYAAPGVPIPEVALLLEADDPAEARQTADRLLRTVAERAGGEVTEDGEVTTAVFSGFTVNLATVESTVVLTTAKSAIAQMGGQGDKLSDSARYKDALEAAGVPADYTGLAYIDLSEALELIMGFASTSGEDVPPEISRNLEPLESVVAFGAKDGDLGKALFFLEIE